MTFLLAAVLALLPAPEEVLVESGEVTLAGTLILPIGEPRGGVVLIAGSGATDRDGNQGTLRPDTLKLLAEGLRGRGWAVLRYDKRGVGASTLPAAGSPEELADHLGLSDFAADAAAAGRWLDARVDGPLVLAGHSEGGMLALMAAREAGADRLVLLATPGRSLPAVLKEQLGARIADGGLRARVLADVDRAVAHAAGGGAFDAEFAATLSPLVRPLFNPTLTKYWREAAAFVPADAAAGGAGEVGAVGVVVVLAEHDAQVTLEAAREAWAGREVVVIEGASHNFKPAASPAAFGIAGELVTGVVGVADVSTTE